MSVLSKKFNGKSIGLIFKVRAIVMAAVLGAMVLLAACDGAAGGGGSSSSGDGGSSSSGGGSTAVDVGLSNLHIQGTGSDPAVSALSYDVSLSNPEGDDYRVDTTQTDVPYSSVIGINVLAIGTATGDITTKLAIEATGSSITWYTESFNTDGTYVKSADQTTTGTDTTNGPEVSFGSYDTSASPSNQLNPVKLTIQGTATAADGSTTEETLTYIVIPAYVLGAGMDLLIGDVKIHDVTIGTTHSRFMRNIEINGTNINIYQDSASALSGNQAVNPVLNPYRVDGAVTYTDTSAVTLSGSTPLVIETTQITQAGAQALSIDIVEPADYAIAGQAFYLSGVTLQTNEVSYTGSIRSIGAATPIAMTVDNGAGTLSFEGYDSLELAGTAVTGLSLTFTSESAVQYVASGVSVATGYTVEITNESGFFSNLNSGGSGEIVLYRSGTGYTAENALVVRSYAVSSTIYPSLATWLHKLEDSTNYSSYGTEQGTWGIVSGDTTIFNDTAILQRTVTDGAFTATGTFSMTVNNSNLNDYKIASTAVLPTDAVAVGVAISDTGEGQQSITLTRGTVTKSYALNVVEGSAETPTPTGLAATGENQQIDLSWSAADGATGYTIYWSTTSGEASSGTEITISSGATTSYTHTALTAGTTYYYVIVANYASGDSVASAEVNATTQALPTIAVTTGKDTTISLADLSDTELFTVSDVSAGATVSVVIASAAAAFTSGTLSATLTGDKLGGSIFNTVLNDINGQTDVTISINGGVASVPLTIIDIITITEISVSALALQTGGGTATETLSVANGEVVIDNTVEPKTIAVTFPDRVVNNINSFNLFDNSTATYSATTETHSVALSTTQLTGTGTDVYTVSVTINGTTVTQDYTVTLMYANTATLTTSLTSYGLADTASNTDSFVVTGLPSGVVARLVVSQGGNSANVAGTIGTGTNETSLGFAPTANDDILKVFQVGSQSATYDLQIERGTGNWVSLASPLTLTTNFTDAEGNFLLSTEADLLEIDSFPTESYKLANDIALTTTYSDSIVSGTFTGSFDGQSNTISNLITSSDNSFHGIFSDVNDATIENVKISLGTGSGMTVGGKDNNQGGILVGRGGPGFQTVGTDIITISNVEIDGNGQTITSSESHFAALIGYSSAPVTINNTGVYNITLSNTAANPRVGGFVGVTQYTTTTATISRSFFDGTLITPATHGGSAIGGFIGFSGWINSEFVITDSYANVSFDTAVANGSGIFVGWPAGTGASSITTSYGITDSDHGLYGSNGGSPSTITNVYSNATRPDGTIHNDATTLPTGFSGTVWQVQTNAWPQLKNVAGQPTIPMPLSLTSASFTDEGTIPDANAGGLSGGGTSPQLTWTNVPDGTGGFIIYMYDEDFPTFPHLLVDGVASTTTSSVAGNLTNYAGPDPPQGETHTYHFLIFAIAESSAEFQILGGFFNEAIHTILQGYHDTSTGTLTQTGTFTNPDDANTVTVLGVAKISGTYTGAIPGGDGPR